MKALIGLTLLFSCAYASPPIEGGRAAPIGSWDYIDIIKLEQHMGGTCTGTRIRPNFILTAAHCVVDPDNGFKEKYGKGPIGIVGEVKATHVHPKYRGAVEAVKAYKNEIKEAWKNPANRAAISEKIDVLRVPRTLHDIAIIELEERESKRTLPFPKLISPNTKFNKRDEIQLAGFGSTGIAWNGNNFEFDDYDGGLRLGNNNWVSCPKPAVTSGQSELRGLASDLSDVLSIQSERTHEITNGRETIINADGTSMVMSGDSGSPALEKDADGNWVVTAVASNIEPYEAGSGKATVKILKDGKLVDRVVFAEFPTDWGDKKKGDTQFEEINVELRKHGLVDEYGSPMPSVQIVRSYTRVTKGNFADLGHPENQEFIQNILEKD